MGEDEFLVTMQRVADALPDRTSPEVTALIIANMIMVYEQQQECPHIMALATTILADAIAEDRKDEETAATKDADVFLKKIMENHND